jgi:hypothetical protein
VEPPATAIQRDGRESRHLPESADQAVTSRDRLIWTWFRQQDSAIFMLQALGWAFD